MGLFVTLKSLSTPRNLMIVMCQSLTALLLLRLVSKLKIEPILYMYRKMVSENGEKTKQCKNHQIFYEMPNLENSRAEIFPQTKETILNIMETD